MRPIPPDRSRSTATTLAALAAIATTVATTALAGDDSYDQRHKHPPVRLKILAPDSGYFSGLTTTAGWPLLFRLEIRDAVAIVETPEEAPSGRREAVVLRDPDGCLDMRHFPITNPRPYTNNCTGGPDESFLEFTTERFDTFDIADVNTGNFQVRQRLVDEVYTPGVIGNKPYLRTTAGAIAAVQRPQTGGNLVDGYGFGPDDDLPGLVIMADIGAARGFDADFNSVTPKLVRNMGGLLTNVAQELLVERGGSALTAGMTVVAGTFEPLAQFDLDVNRAGVDFLRRLESGPVEEFRYPAPPANDDEKLAALLATYSPIYLNLRAVVVEGVGPALIEDKNGDGHVTAKDLTLMGYKILSNEVRLRALLDFDVLVTQTVTGRTCPPASLIYKDLDGNGRDGAVNCQGSGGAGRIRSVPQ